MQRSINSYIGVPIDTAYDKVLFSEYTRNLVVKPLEYYTEAALENRLEIISVAEEIKTKEKHLEILEIAGQRIYILTYAKSMKMFCWK